MGDCDCSWKCLRIAYGATYGTVGLAAALFIFENYWNLHAQGDDITSSTPIILVIINLLALLLACIALLYTVIKIDAKFIIIIIGYIIFEVLYSAVLVICYIVTSARDNIAKECCVLLFHMFSLYIMYKIRDDIRAEKSQLPPVYYNAVPIPPGNTPYPQLPQQDQQPFVAAMPYYAPLPQQYSPVSANSFYPPTMQPQPLDPNMCPPTMQPQPLGPNMYPPLPQQQLPQPSAPFNQFNNV